MSNVNMNTLIEDIRQLRGAEVSIFGQSQTLEAETDQLEIDIVDVMEALSEYESDLIMLKPDGDDYEEIQADSVDEFLEFKESIGDISYKDSKGDNSYNWLAPLNHDFDINIIHDMYQDTYLYEFKVHRFGDVRGNYTDTVLLEFYDEHTFMETLLGCNKAVFITVDGTEYDVMIDLFSDTFEVIETETGAHIGDVTCYDMDELKQEIKELVE